MLLKIDFSALHHVKEHWRGIGITLFVNWAVKPFSVALLGWVFIRMLFAEWLPADQIDSYIAGLILLAAAPCTAFSRGIEAKRVERDNLRRGVRGVGSTCRPQRGGRLDQVTGVGVGEHRLAETHGPLASLVRLEYTVEHVAEK